MNQYDALISALVATDKLLNDDGISYTLLVSLTKQRDDLIRAIAKAQKESEIS
jgi:hypothetical protein